ncbi:integral membrane protein [Grosmannia clavigera kw1407]|uniref:Integral membrane protein n=1 Tax=Grosmannia clavigera (strain kw1407 / UAMH 11150) TaxID=655863 RepID=F0XB87_GROCL|nr:uncharacterized protein CMQ_5241 [Grosmannia clavigera kw1407]EFX04979.1 integral membrane protein [Grosmannia clavigera kw1407]
MRGLFSHVLLLLCVVFPRFSQAETPQLSSCAVCLPRFSLMSGVKCELPFANCKCAQQLSCLLQAMPQTPCTLTNNTCLCTNTELTSLVTVCLLANCTNIELLTTTNVTSINCDAPIRRRQQSLKATAIALSVLSGIFVALRCGYRAFILHTRLEPDDWCIMATSIVAIPQIVLVIHGTIANGLGRDIWTLPVHKIYKFGRFLYALEMQYFISLMMLKVSLLLFYLRIFPDRNVRRILWSTVAFVVGVSVSFIFLSMFQCRPISYYWTAWDGEHKGHCINGNAIAWAHAAFSIIVDFWMLAIPLSQLRHIKLGLTKKVGVAMMFCVGTFVTVVSILRLRSLVSFSKSSNPTWENSEVSNWSTIEVCVGIICTCMPSLRLILARISPSVFGGSSARTYANYPEYGHNYVGPNVERGHSRVIGSIALVSTGRSHNKDQNTLTTDTINDRSGSGTIPNKSNSANKSSASEDIHGITYSKSYAVEYGSEYNDQARLVDNNAASSHLARSDTIKSTDHNGVN